MRHGSFREGLAETCSSVFDSRVGSQVLNSLCQDQELEQLLVGISCFCRSKRDPRYSGH